MTEKNSIQEIMLRYLNGESTEEESKELHAWINANKANEDEFKMIQSLWTDSEDAALIPVDTEKAWKEIQSKTIDKRNKVTPSFRLKRFFAIAASILLVLGAVYFFYQMPNTDWKLTVAKEDNKVIHIANGSTITLRRGSRLYLPKNHEAALRKVKLEGVAYFEIAHQASSPFEVLTTNSIITDIGTSFIVKSNDSLDQVTVLSGKVNFANKKQEKKAIILKAGQSAILKDDTPQKEKINIANALSWKTDVLIFQHTPLYQVAADLRDYYQIEVVISDHLGATGITAEFRKDSMSQVLKELRLITGLQFQLKKDTLFISK